MKFIWLILFIFCSSVAQAATITVNVTADSAVGADITNCTLRKAVIAANTNAAVDGCAAGSGTDTIILSAPLDAGVAEYTLSLAGIENAAATGDLDITQSVNIQGVSAAVSIINGGAIDRVFHLPSSGPTLSLSNMTVRNGNPGNTGGSGNGGAGVMVANGATLNVSNCIFRNHVSVLGTSVGGGAIDSQGVFVITNSEFYDNISQNDGAIRCLATCTGSITDTSIHDNTATTYVGGGLGAAGNLSLLRVQVYNNDNQGPGGAGGLSCLQATNGTNVITVADSLFYGNTSVTDGGGIAVFDIPAGGFGGVPNVTITNTTISGNSAQGAGGGIFVRNGTLQLNNVTITNNTADSDNNSGSNQGGGIFRSSGTLNIRNSIVANNFDTGAAAANVDCSGTVTTQGYNLVRYASACTGIVNGESGDLTNVNPLLSALADNGGPTQTHAISLTSPALNSGNPVGCAGGSGTLTADQRGVARTGQGICDRGAYEFSCGYGTTDATAGEQCDDGNNTTEACTYGLTSCSVCSATCQTQAGAVTYCGDNITQGGSGETCDDGNTVTETCTYGLSSCVVCNATCQSVAGATSTCGDGVVQGGNGETCDDGNTVTESCAYGALGCTVCAGNCTSVAGPVSSCGDGVVQGAFEDCDDSNDDTEVCDYGEEDCTVCNADCESVAGETSLCGDGDIQGSEACDDGNTITEECTYTLTSCTVCANNCTITSGSVSYCGDGVVQSSQGEVCDEGAENGDSDCFSDCQPVQLGGGASGGSSSGSSTSGATTTAQGAAAAGCSLNPRGSMDLSWVYLIAVVLFGVRKRFSA